MVYEVPYMIGEHAVQGWRQYVGRLQRALAEGRRGDAGELFMRLAGSPEEQIAAARNSRHTLAYDAACLGDGEPPTERLATISQPTLVVTGGGNDFFESAADAIPNGERLTLTGQGHVVDPKAMASELRRFFGADEA